MDVGAQLVLHLLCRLRMGEFDGYRGHDGHVTDPSIDCRPVEDLSSTHLCRLLVCSVGHRSNLLGCCPKYGWVDRLSSLLGYLRG